MTAGMAVRPWHWRPAARGWFSWRREWTLLALYLFVEPLAGSGPVMNLLGIAPVLAIIAGVRMYRPAAALCMDVVRRRLHAVLARGPLHLQLPALMLNREVPFPSLGDAAYLAVSPALMAGLRRSWSAAGASRVTVVARSTHRS